MDSNLNNSYSSYFNENLEDPNFLYLGSPREIDFEKIKIKYGDVTDFSMYLTSNYHLAVADAFALKMAEKNVGKPYTLEIMSNAIPILIADGITDLSDYDTGLLYIFECPEDVISDDDYHFKVTKPLIPVETKKLVYRDHKCYYRINKTKQKVKELSN